jgi:hypothetical protein
MKTMVFVLFLLGANVALAQSYGNVLNNQPQFVQFYTHAEHASTQPLATPQYILGNSSATSAHGVRPLWEFPVAEAVPLGDVARLLRKQHELAKKAEKVFSDQR